MSKHTPGPWFVTQGPFKEGCAVYMQGGMRPIAHIKPLEHCDGNAHLIAASPDMLRAAEVSLDFLETVRNFLGAEAQTALGIDDMERVLRSVIAKAEGRS